MFTGIVEETGIIAGLNKSGNGAVLKIYCKKVLKDTVPGDSIAVNGICLTVTNLNENFFNADISFETLDKSSLKYLRINSLVNLERALTLNTRLGGHLVSGHVDGTGYISYIKSIGESYLLGVRYPMELDKYIAVKGSLTIDGISLTVAGAKNGICEVAVIPHTFNNTNLKDKKNNDPVNLEVDMIARYLEKLLINDNENTLKEKLQYLNYSEEI